MKNLQSMFYTIVMVLGLTSVSNAASLGGLYFEVGSSAAGVELDGSHNDNNGDVSKGTVGKTAVIAHYGLGFMTPRSSKVGLDFGYMITPGEAKINATSDDSNTDVSFEVADGDEFYIAPMVNITEDASIYLKYGWSKADVNVTGDIKDPGDLEGTTVALGTVMSWGSNLYIRTEAGMTDYDSLSAKGLGNTIGTDEEVTANPEVYYGKIAIGYKF